MDSDINNEYLNAQRTIIQAIEQQLCEDKGEISDGYHTFNQLYHQRAILFATIVNQNKDKAWKSFKHSDGHYCFDEGGEMFIVGIDTPKGSYTYHYHKKYWDYFDCKELEYGKVWDGHTEEDVTRLLSLEQQPNRCDSCTHSEERDGSNCYECIKGMADNFEEQSTSDDDIIKALKAVRTIHNGNYAPQIDEAIRRLKAQPSEDYDYKALWEQARWERDVALEQLEQLGYSLGEKIRTDGDCINRSELLRHQHIIYDDDGEDYNAVYVKDIKALPSVTPRTNLAETSQDCISREAVQDLISSWLSDYLLDETREALETINYKVGDMPSVYPERPKPDMIERIKKSIDEMTEIHSDGEFYIKNVDAKWIIGKYLYGAEMRGGREE